MITSNMIGTNFWSGCKLPPSPTATVNTALMQTSMKQIPHNTTFACHIDE